MKMAYGVIDVQYGGVRSTKVVEKEEFYSPLCVPAMAEVKLYINMEEYRKLDAEMGCIEQRLRERRVTCNNAYKEMGELKDKLEGVMRECRELSERLERANRTIDWMLERCE